MTLAGICLPPRGELTLFCGNTFKFVNNSILLTDVFHLQQKREMYKIT